MAKKSKDSSFPWLTILGVGIAGVAIYEIISYSKSPAAPVAPPATPGAAPAAPAAAPQAKLQDFGPKYQSLRDDIDTLNAQLSNRQISSEQYQDSKGVLSKAISDAFLDGRITVNDSMALKSRFTA